MHWIAIGALGCALSVAAGAFGAHGLKARLDPAALTLWETAARYLMYGSLGVTLLGITSQLGARPALGAAGYSLVAGTLIFSGTVMLLAVGGPRWLGAVTPIGGLLMIVGFVLFALGALRA
jgi:uncharacterized membrane protein YgdD (TMEM256/DUF423 family)